MSEALAPAQARPRFPALNIALFLATIATTLSFGATYGAESFPRSVGRIVATGFPYAATLIAILLSHEMGHYLMARVHGVDSTLPFFIPVPPPFIGTLGAVIRIRSAMPSRRAVLEIGAAGPIAGFLVAVPLLLWGIAHSELKAAPTAAAVLHPWGSSALGLLWRVLTGAPRGGDFMGDSLVTWAAGRLVLGHLPPGQDFVLNFHPVAFASWIGLFVTTLNLIPLGQLDGGHVVYALLGGRRALVVSRLVSVGLLLCGLFASFNWLVWWLLTRFIGLHHPPAMREEPLGRAGRILALASLLLFAATFIPVPFYA